MKRALLFLSFLIVLPALAAIQPGTLLSSGPTQSKRIALTFDDGPGPNTGKFLDLLNQYGVKATFFVLGDQVKARPAMAKRIIQEGHEIGNHTMSHINYVKRYRYRLEQNGGEAGREKAVAAVKADLIADMNESRRVIEKTAGVKLKILRMPHGVDKPWVKEAAKEAGFILVNWSYGADWTSPPSPKDGFGGAGPPPDPIESLKESYVKALKPGTIYLVHDGWPKSEKSLAVTEAILKAAKEQGYEIVTVGELLGL